MENELEVLERQQAARLAPSPERALTPTSAREEGGKHRIQVDMSASEIQRLNWIMEVCDISTRRELFNVALTLLEWSANEATQGRKVASFDDTTKDRYILSMPALAAAATHNHRYANFSPQAAEPQAVASRPRQMAAGSGDARRLNTTQADQMWGGDASSSDRQQGF